MKAFFHQTKIARFILVLIVMSMAAESISATETFTLRGSASELDTRKNYPIAAIKLALEKTKDKYGDYRIEFAPDLNTLRLLAAARNNVFPNLVVQSGYDDNFLKQKGLTYIPVPFDLGITGYRLCFANPQVEPKLQKVSSLKELSQFSIAQGVGWVDTKILRHNGFTVIESNSYEGLFKMTAAQRTDLFCRGINEFKSELYSRSDIENIMLDTSFAIYYTMPRFFYLSDKNIKAKERLELGFNLAYNDGSLKKLLLSYYADNIALANIANRKIFILENPLIKNIDPKYKHYNFLQLGKSQFEQ